jgi:hypothetical protein
MAVLAMILGIFGVVACLTVFLSFVAFVPGLAAVVLGWIALRQSHRLDDRTGRLQAIVAVVTGIVSTMGSVVAFAVVAIFVGSSDQALVDEEPARPDDFELSDRTCRVDDGRAVATGVLTNRSGETHGWALDVTFLDGEQEMGTLSDELESDLADGASWAWEVVMTVDPEQVNTDGLDCRVDRVELGEVVSD